MEEIKMAQVVCLVGPMACGKNAIYDKCKQYFTPTKSITTRSIRETEMLIIPQ